MIEWFLFNVKLAEYQEEFEDTKGLIRIRISKKIRQHNGQKKKDKRTNNDLQNIHIKLKIE
jgi:chloramphenicol O-acetyltransferase